MERKDIEDLIRGSLKPVKQEHRQGDPAIDALVKLAILAITAIAAMAMLVIVTRAG